MSKYYVLSQEGELVLIELGYEPGYGQILALAVYTSEGGGQQREDLQRYKDTEVLPMSAEEILALIQPLEEVLSEVDVAPLAYLAAREGASARKPKRVAAG